MQVFGEYTPQEEVFSVIGQPMVEEVLQGFNGTIFAYGQSGTGKTFTMEGADWDGPTLGHDAGVIPRTVVHIFNALANIPEDNYAVKVSFLEIYNEELFDLLHPGKVPPCAPIAVADCRITTPRSWMSLSTMSGNSSIFSGSHVRHVERRNMCACRQSYASRSRAAK